MFTIYANGTPMGDYAGKTEMQAIRAFFKDAGYRSPAEAAKTLGVSLSTLLSELRVVRKGKR